MNKSEVVVGLVVVNINCGAVNKRSAGIPLKLMAARDLILWDEGGKGK